MRLRRILSISQAGLSIDKGVCPVTYFHFYASPLGKLLACSDGERLTGLWFEGQAHCPMVSPGAEKAIWVFESADRWLDEYFTGREPGFTPPVLLRGTPFQRAVWELLLTIPRGRTETYGGIAKRLSGASPRAVGQAVGRNPVSIIVPCHRVLGVGGRLTGYAGGLERKRGLLRLEGAWPEAEDD